MWQRGHREDGIIRIAEAHTSVRRPPPERGTGTTSSMLNICSFKRVFGVVFVHRITTTQDGGTLVTFAINEDFVPQIALLLDAKRRGAVLLLQIVEQ